MQPESDTNKSEQLPNEFFMKPVSWSVALLALVLITSLSLSGIVANVIQLKTEYVSTLNNLENQLATVVASQRGQEMRNSSATEKLNNFEAVESNQIIVKYKEEAELPQGLQIAAERANLERAQGLNHLLTIQGINAHVYRISEDDTAQEVVNRILAETGDLIEYAEVDMLVPLAYTPNDPSLSNSWHLNKINAPLAWDSSQGEGVVIAIADTGVNCNHVDLADNCVSGWNTVSNNDNTSDIHGHGTAVAGAAAQMGDNAVGSAGVAYKAKIMPMRVTDSPDGWATYSAIASAFTWAADRGAKVASASFSGVCSSASILSASQYLRSKGGIAVGAAGNDGTDPGFANSEFITCVSSTNSNDTRTSWSNYGAFIDAATPGASIYTTLIGGGYGSVSGTSISAPMAAGIYALIFATNPALTPLQADSILFSSADDLGEAGWDKYYGHGRINAGGAVSLAQATIGTQDTVPPTVPTNLRYSDLKSNSVVLEWNPSTDDNSGVAGYSVFRNGTKITTVAGTKFTNTNLTPNTSYTYTVQADDVAGNTSTQSSPLTITTPDIDFAISSHSVPSKTDTSATVAVTLNKPGTVTVRYGTQSSNLDMTTSVSAESLTHSISIANLSPSTTYYYQVVATDRTTTITSSVSSFKTNKASRGGGGSGNTGGGPKR